MTPASTAPVACLNCGSEHSSPFAKAQDIEYFTSGKTFTYLQCHHCQVLFIDPVPLRQLAVIYPSNYYSFAPAAGGISLKIKSYLDRLFFKKLLKALPAQTLNILDVGGGTGWLAGTIRSIDKRVAKTQVVDIDPQAAALAQSNGHDYFCGPIELFDTSTRYHIILLLNLIEHVASPQKVLQKAQQLLAPGGIIVVKTPNYKSWDAKLFKNNNWGGYHCPRHWVIFDQRSFGALSDHCGLAVKQFNYTQGAPFWTVGILHWMHKKKWIKASAQRPLVYHPLFGIISMATATFDFLRKPFAPLSQMFFILTKK